MTDKAKQIKYKKPITNQIKILISIQNMSRNSKQT